MKKFYMRSGSIVDFDLNEIDYVPLEDILYSLAKEFRFHGQSTWSVLQHLLVTGQTAARLECNTLLIKHAYTHDFAEAFIRDIPTGLKTKEIIEIEDDIYSKLMKFMNIPKLSIDDKDTLKQLDLHARLVEAKFAFDDIGLYEVILEEVTVEPSILMETTISALNVMNMKLFDKNGELQKDLVESFKSVLGPY